MFIKINETIAQTLLQLFSISYDNRNILSLE